VGRPHQAILVPEEALASDQGQRYVFVVDSKNEIVYRKVKIGMQVDQYRVIESGLSADDTIVRRGLQRVKVGGKVIAKTEAEDKAEQEKQKLEAAEAKAKKEAEAKAKEEGATSESPKADSPSDSKAKDK
jgi:hypothetical protein